MPSVSDDWGTHGVRSPRVAGHRTVGFPCSSFGPSVEGLAAVANRVWFVVNRVIGLFPLDDILIPIQSVPAECVPTMEYANQYKPEGNVTGVKV